MIEGEQLSYSVAPENVFEFHFLLVIYELNSPTVWKGGVGQCNYTY